MLFCRRTERLIKPGGAFSKPKDPAHVSKENEPWITALGSHCHELLAECAQIHTAARTPLPPTQSEEPWSDCTSLRYRELFAFHELLASP